MGNLYPELQTVLKHIVSVVDSSQLLAKYTSLVASMETARTTAAATADVTQPIEQLKSEIEEIQNKLEPRGFDPLARATFYEFDQAAVLGTRGIQALHAALGGSGYEISQKIATVKDLGTRIGNEVEKARRSYENLEDIFGENQTEEDEKENSHLQITFDGEVAINNLDQLEGQTKFWITQIKLANQVIPNGPDGVSLDNIHKFNPTIFELCGGAGGLWLLFRAFREALEILNMAVTTKKNIAELQTMYFTKSRKTQIEKQMNDGLEETISAELEKRTKTVADEVKQKYQVEVPTEHENPIYFLIRNDYDFVQHGGDLAYRESAQEAAAKTETDIEQDRLIENMREMVKIAGEEKILLLLPKATLSKEETKKAEEMANATPTITKIKDNPETPKQRGRPRGKAKHDSPDVKKEELENGEKQS